MKRDLELPPEQQAIRDKCFHPSGRFVEFPIEYVESSVCERFEKIAAEYPDNWAIVTDLESLTYAELNERSNRVSRSILERLDTGSEPIGLLFDAKLTLIIAMLGVMKAGKAIVLLDPSAPSARLQTMVNDTQSKLLLTEAALHAKALELGYEQHQVLDIDRCAHHHGGNLQLPIRPEALLGISYTSGSTGKPKGAIWNHRSVLHQVMLFANVFHYCSRDRISYLVSSGNAALCQPFYALLVGGTVCPFDVKREGLDALALWLKQKEISVCALGAGLFRAFANIQPARLDLPHLRLLRLSSEASYKGDFARYQERLPRGCLLSNGISPSETALQSVYLMNHESVIDTDEIPIGYPVQDKEVLLLNDSGEDVGFNQVGEIAVRSAYLSSGYWNRPELTSAKFTVSHSGALPIYHTGDLGVRLPDGCLVYKGRKDFRLKVRGYSVEPAEVESIMRQHPRVREVCVIGRVDELSGVTRLLGYFTQVSGAGLVGSELRAFISRQLPDYMVPSACISLTAFPLTDSGKVNRAALPAPVTMELVSGAAYVPPTDQCEASLVAIWSEVLGVAAAGINDSFFNLGGDSLSAMRILARVRNSLQADIPLIEFYEAQTIAALALLVRRSSDAKLTAKKLQRRERLNPIPLSLMQERLWFVEKLEPHAHRSNLVAAFSLRGPVDAAALETAINQVVQRHEVLRTVFGCADGKPFQVILDSLPIGLRAIDAESGPGNSLDSRVQLICIAEAGQPFDLERGPLLRASLVRSGTAAHALILAVHHIIFDGWSMDILCRELSANYNAALARQSFEVAPLLIHYADFAIWQHDADQQQSFDADLVFWRKELTEAPVLRLPTDRPRPQFRNSRATRQWFTIAPSVTQLLKDTSREAGATLFMNLLAVYQTLLFRYSGQEDICVGIPVAGRDEEAADDLIGFFVNMLVLRADLSGNPRFSDFLARVRHCCLEAYAHQKAPFDRIVKELQPNRLINQHPLFQVSFALRHGGACALHLNGLAVEEIEVDPGISRFDLELYMEEKNGGLHGFLAGSSDLFDRSTITRMIDHFGKLLEAIANDPNRRMSDLPILTEAEQHRLLVEWNETKRDYPKNKCLHQLFEEQVKRTPDSVAVVYESQELTYRDLNRRASRLAHRLRGLGVGPDVLVGLCVERSIDLLIGILGVLKAGGAYVPLDPNYPKDRLDFMLKDSAVSLVLTRKHFAANLPVLSSIVLYDLDQPEQIAREATHEANFERNVSPDNLAYVIYTSGSTGQPKGVLVTHHNVVRLFQSTQTYFNFNSSDVWTFFHSCAFDFSVWEIWGALLHGGRLIIVPDSVRQSPDEFATLIQENCVTVLNQTPSAFQQLMPHLISKTDSAKQTLRHVIFGGEALEAQRLQPWLDRHGDQTPKLINMYGITETTVHATYREITHADIESKAENIIGKPIPDMKMYVLNSYKQLQPIGIPGEIYIGGAGVAKGYHKRSELTAERFIADPFSNDPRARLYKSGDLARWLPNGELEYLGRIDDQVKIRGYRIELGEIECVLKEYPGFEQVVVIARKDNPENQILIAYFVAAEGHILETDEAKRFLRTKLPEYMIPTVWVMLPSLPRLPNGKVDRRSLPAPEKVKPERLEATGATLTPLEKLLAQVWAELMPHAEFGIEDNFFELGGHSLLATQVVARLGKILNGEIPLRFLFEAPTIRELALRITTYQNTGSSAGEGCHELKPPTGEEMQSII